MAPTANADIYNVLHDRTLTIAAPGLLANDTDPDGDTIFVNTFTAPTHGTLTQIVTDRSFQYVPMRASSASTPGPTRSPTARTPARARLRSTTRNAAPVAGNDAYSVQEGNTLTVAAPGLLANDSDTDGDTIFADTFTTPTHGTLTQIVTDGSFIYVPDAGFVGVDTWTYTISDGATSATGTVRSPCSKARPVRQRGRLQRAARPRAHDPGARTAGQRHDPNGDTIFADTFTAPTHGTLTQIVTDGSFQYVPDGRVFVGVDTWTYTISDGTNSGTGTVTINVTNAAPVVGNDAYSVQEGNTLTIAAPGLLANDTDPDGDTIFVNTFTAPTHGTLAQIVTDGSFQYVADAGFVGVDTWTYTVSDGAGSATGTVTITVSSGNTAPLAGADAYAVKAGTVLTIDAPGVLANDTDADGDALVVTLITNPADHGTLSLFPDGHFIYTPTAGYIGADSFTYRISDGFGGTADGVVTLDVFNANPLAGADAYAVKAGTVLTIDAPGVLANDTDADGDALVVTLITNPADHGTLSLFPDGHFIYTPTAGYIGLTASPTGSATVSVGRRMAWSRSTWRRSTRHP